MSSEKKTPELIALEKTRTKKITILAENLKLDIDKNREFIVSFLNKLANTLGFEATQKHIEAIDFIILNNPENLIEVFHLLHLFMINEINSKLFMCMNNTQYTEHLKDFARIVLKGTNAFNTGITALKAYRNGINITKNIQNNTLNQMYVANKNDDVRRIEKKEDFKYDKKMNCNYNTNLKTHK